MQNVDLPFFIFRAAASIVKQLLILPVMFSYSYAMRMLTYKFNSKFSLFTLE